MSYDQKCFKSIPDFFKALYIDRVQSFAFFLAILNSRLNYSKKGVTESERFGRVLSSRKVVFAQMLKNQPNVLKIVFPMCVFNFCVICMQPMLCDQYRIGGELWTFLIKSLITSFTCNVIYSLLSGVQND